MSTFMDIVLLELFLSIEILARKHESLNTRELFFIVLFENPISMSHKLQFLGMIHNNRSYFLGKNVYSNIHFIDVPF